MLLVGTVARDQMLQPLDLRVTLRQGALATLFHLRATATICSLQPVHLQLLPTGQRDSQRLNRWRLRENQCAVRPIVHTLLRIPNLPVNRRCTPSTHFGTSKRLQSSSNHFVDGRLGGLQEQNDLSHSDYGLDRRDGHAV